MSSITYEELQDASMLACLTGLTYLPLGKQPEAIKEQGLKFIAGSRDKFTSWIVADNQPSSTLPSSERTRYILLRGVQWGAQETNLTELTLQLGKSWPSAFGRTSVDTAPASPHIVCHQGIKEIALETFAELAPFLRNLPPQTRVVFSGHSLGGSIAQILWALSLIHGHRSASLCSVHSFGSPPIFSVSADPPAAVSSPTTNTKPSPSPSSSQERKALINVLDLLPGLPPPSSCRNWIQENDPVPRAMTTSDPYLQLTLQNSLVRSILGLVSPSPSSSPPSLSSPTRLLYKHVGEILLIKPGCQIVKLLPGEERDETDSALKMSLSFDSLTDIITRPHVGAAWLLDHHHGSYCTDLQRAARAHNESERGTKVMERALK